MTVKVKICGVTDRNSVDCAATAGARYLGFVFFKKSPRNISHDHAAQLATHIPAGICKTALLVDPTDAQLDHLLSAVPIDMLQLHGREPVDRVGAIKSRYGLPVMKAVGIADETDLASLSDYSRIADQILVDAKPAKTNDLPGGNGLSFDWRLLAGRRWALPWMLAGGLTADNVANAIALTGAQQVDVSSGVEDAPGLKSSDKIRAFLAQAQAVHKTAPPKLK